MKLLNGGFVGGYSTSRALSSFGQGMAQHPVLDITCSRGSEQEPTSSTRAWFYSRRHTTATSHAYPTCPELREM